MTDIVDNEMEGREALKLSIPILQNTEDDKWQNKLWDDKLWFVQLEQTPGKCYTFIAACIYHSNHSWLTINSYYLKLIQSVINAKTFNNSFELFLTLCNTFRAFPIKQVMTGTHFLRLLVNHDYFCTKLF